MTRSFETRRAVPEDATALADIIRRLGDENVALSGEYDAARVEQWIRRVGDQGIMLVAFDGSIPVAFGSLDYSTSEPETGIIGVWVLPEHRRRGLATTLAEEMLEFARENGFRRIRGRLPEGNEPALSFLSGIGAMVPLRNPSATFELPL